MRVGLGIDPRDQEAYARAIALRRMAMQTPGGGARGRTRSEPKLVTGSVAGLGYPTGITTADDRFGETAPASRVAGLIARATGGQGVEPGLVATQGSAVGNLGGGGPMPGRFLNLGDPRLRRYNAAETAGFGPFPGQTLDSFGRAVNPLPDVRGRTLALQRLSMGDVAVRQIDATRRNLAAEARQKAQAQTKKGNRPR